MAYMNITEANQLSMEYCDGKDNIIIIGKHATKGAAGQHTHYIATLYIRTKRQQNNYDWSRWLAKFLMES